MAAHPIGTLRRYARMYHRARRVYGNAIAPGPTPDLVMFAVSGTITTPTPRRELRPLRWYERLLDR